MLTVVQGAADNFIAWEGEDPSAVLQSNFNNGQDWYVIDSTSAPISALGTVAPTTASGGKAITSQTPADGTSNTGNQAYVTYTLNVVNAGDYHLYVRRMIQNYDLGNPDNNNSFFAPNNIDEAPGGAFSTFNNDNGAVDAGTEASGQYDWVGSTSHPSSSGDRDYAGVTAGIHTFTIQTREGGYVIDRVVLAPAGLDGPALDALANSASATTPLAIQTLSGFGQIALHVSGGPANADTYNIKRSTTPGGPYVTVKSGLSSVSARKFVDTGLANATTYYYVVSSVTGGVESANSAQFSAPTAVVGTGTGLVASYHNLAGGTNTTGADHLLGAIGYTAIEGPIDFGFGSNAPRPGVQADDFTSRYDGSVLAPFTGDYIFNVISDDGESLFVDGVPVVQDETLHGDTSFLSAPIHMDAGTKHSIMYFGFERGGGATAKLHWSLPGIIADQAIPANQLYPTIAGQAADPAATNLTAAANGTSVDLTFDDNATDELWYSVRRSPSGVAGTFTEVGKAGGGAFGAATSGITFTDSSANGGSKYFYQVVPVNFAGAGAVSNTAGPVTTDPFDPGAQFTGPGTGIAGHYWQQGGNEPDTHGAPAANELDAFIDYANNGWVLPVGSTNNFTAEWTGQVMITTAGAYTFQLASDDAGYFYIDGVLQASDPGGHGERNINSPVLNLTAGGHNIDFQMGEGGGGYGAHLRYSGPDTGGNMNVVPTTAYNPQVNLTAPSGLAANNITKTTLGVTFTDNSHGLTMLLERATQPNFSDAAEIVLGVNPSGSYADSGLTGNTDYYYRAREVHRFDGFTPYSTVLHVKTLAFDPTPNAPTGLSVSSPSALTSVQTTLRWTDNAANETGFKIERKDVTAAGSYAQIGTVGANVTIYVDSDVALVTGHVYSYRVRATNPAATLPDGVTLAPDSAYTNEASGTAGLGITGTGTGVDGYYFNAQNIVNGAAVFTGILPVAIRHDPVVDFNFDAGNGGCTLQCPTGFSHDNTQIKWYGQFQAQTSEPYTFSTASDDGSDLYLDTGAGLVQVVNNNFYQGRTERSSAPISLVAGQKYNIYGTFYQGGGGTNVTWFLSTPSISHEVIPTSQLYGVDESVKASAPTVLKGAANPKGAAVLTWTDTSFNEKGFKVERSDTAGGPYTTIATLPTDTTFYTDASATLGKKYFYIVASTNAAGDSSSNEVGVTTSLGVIGTGTGVDGYYYDAQVITNTAADFTGLTPVAARADGPVNFNFDTTAQGQRPVGFDHDNEMIQWFGYLQGETTDSYTFSTASDDGSDLWLDTGSGLVQIVNNNFYQGRTERFSAPISLVAGQKYPIYGSFYQGGGGTNITWFWQSSGVPHQPIPKSQLYGANDTSTAGPAAPTGTTVTPDVQELIVSWTDSTIGVTDANQESKFIIERSSSAAGPFTKVGESPRNTAVFVDRTATGSATYFYRVKASNQIGDSTYDAVASGTPDADPGSLNIADFTAANQGSLQLNGTSIYNTDVDSVDVLQLTDAINGQSGTALSLGHHRVDGFASSFDFRMAAGNDADGFTFSIVGGTDNTVVGGGGGCLAICGVANSFSVKFDIYPNPRSHTNAEFFFDGNDNDIDTTATSTVNFLDRDLYHVDLAYDYAAKQLVETITSKNTASKVFTHTYTDMDIPAGIGADAGYVGFTGATGGLNEQQFIYNFKFSNVVVVPPHVLNITGTAGNNTILVEHVGTNIEVTVDGVKTVTPESQVTGINVTADGIDDIELKGGFGSAFPITINGNVGTDTLKITNGAVSTLNIASGTVKATNDLVVGIGGTISATAVLDLADHDLIVKADAATKSAVLAAISGYVKAGRNNGAWTGLGGISSSTAAAQAGHLTGLAVALNDKGNGSTLYSNFDGVAVDNNTILVKYTWNGDADLSGKVDSDDYFQIDNGFVLKSTGYRNGDFDFNGTVDASDYFLIDNSFISQTGVLSSSPAAAKTASKSRHHKHKK